jgi:steroid delta-isomerase-like uncharacterized protein
MSAKNKTLVSQIVEELWNKKNPAVIGQLYSENYVGHTPDGVLQGHAGARQHYDTYVAAFPDCKIAIDGVVAEGDKVSVRWMATGTHRGELAGIPPTGKQVSVPGSLTVRISGGKVVEEYNLWDTLKLAQQIGAVGQVGQAKGATR